MASNCPCDKLNYQWGLSEMSYELSKELSESLITKIGFLLLAFLLFFVSLYMVYAVIRKKPLADPDYSDNFIANLPFWDKSLHRIKLLVGGVAGSAFFSWYIGHALRELLK
jgi:hypothetical protein